MDDRVQVLFQKAFRSGIARAYNISKESDTIRAAGRFYLEFQRHVSIWDPNIPLDATSDFPGANRVIWEFPLRLARTRDLAQICTSSPFDSFGLATSCLTMPFVSLGLSDASTSDLDLAARYGIHRSSVPEVSNVTRAFAGYLAGPSSRGAECEMQSLIRNNATLDLQGAAGCLRARCVNASSLLKISPDIIGIGIWTAYFIQVGICFVAPMVVILSLCVYRRRERLSPAPPLSDQSGKSLREEPSKQMSLENRVRNLIAAFVTSLVDFQKAQCYYLIAIQIASKTTLHRDGAEGTVAQREATVTVVRAVATLAVLTPTLILYCLCIMGKRSWYILVLTVTTSALAFNVFFDPDVSRIPDSFYSDPDSANARGNSTNPFPLCSTKLAREGPPWHGISTAWVFYFYGLVVLLFIVDHLFSLGLPSARDRSYLLPYLKVQRSSAELVARLRKRREPTLAKRTWRTVYRLVRFLFFVSMIAISFYVLGQVSASLYSYYAAGMVSHDWSFGQIVSVAVWVPVVVDWLQLSLRGMESGSEYRISSPFRVQQAPQPTSRPPTTSHSDNPIAETRNGIDSEAHDSLNISRRRVATAEF